MYHKITSCRACGLGKAQIPTLKQSVAAGPQSGDTSLLPVFDLGLQPLANDFVQAGEEQSGFAPLKVMLCPRCNMAQLSVVVRPDILYRHYSYVTSPSQTMRDHFQTLVDMIPLASHKPRLLEIGSNDGRFLDFLQNEKGWQVCGIDPAKNLCETAHRRGLKVYCDFFGADAAARIQEFEPEIIMARHVFCHCPDWKDFVRGLEILSPPETLICIEVPYVADLLSKGEFDTVYHEHLSYFSIKPMSHLLMETSLRLHKVVPLSIHGGALLVMLRHRDSQTSPDKSVSQYLNAEDFGHEAWRKFSTDSFRKIGALRHFVDTAVQNGKRVVGYGASAKSTVWINACGFTRNQISFITDTTPEKLYRNSPGTNIPIVDEGALLRELPDYAVCFAWNYIDEILQKEKAYLDRGGKFIVPHPDIKVLP